MNETRKKILEKLIPCVHRCREHKGDTSVESFRDYLGTGGFTFLGGIVSYDKSGIRYEDFERNGNLKIDLTHKEVLEYGISGKCEEQVTLF